MTNNKKCPICRCVNYETKEFYKDKEYFILNNVLIIQKITRGFLLRYHLYIKVFCKLMPINKHLRSLYSGFKIRELTNKIVNTMEKNNRDLQKFLREEEESLKKLEKASSKNTENEISIQVNWSKMVQQVKKRGSESCAICLTSMINKATYITNCSHCFHKNCLDSFEKFDTYYEKRCPICRTNYDKKEIIL